MAANFHLASRPDLMPRVKIGPALPGYKALEVEIARLRDLDNRDLRKCWHAVLGRLPPPHLPRHLAFRILAYRLQADRFGDLDGDSKQLLDRSATRSRHPNARGCGSAAGPRLVMTPKIERSGSMRRKPTGFERSSVAITSLAVSTY